MKGEDVGVVLLGCLGAVFSFLAVIILGIGLIALRVGFVSLVFYLFGYGMEWAFSPGIELHLYAAAGAFVGLITCFFGGGSGD